MFRNKEFKYACLSALVILVYGIYILIHWPAIAVLVLIVVSVLIFAIFCGVTVYRYRKIQTLTDYLYKIGQGESPLILEYYEEGELSALHSEIYKLTQKLSEQAQFLEKDKNYLADAISDISHQLKTPLTSMSVMADLLGSDDLPPGKRREFTVNIQKQLVRMEWLLSSLLKMAKMDAGTVIFKKETIAVRTLLENASEHLLIPMELKNIAFSINCADDVFLGGDRAWLAEALANILKNCLEHTPEDGQIVAVVLADEPTGNLDSKNSEDIVELLKISNQKNYQTLILITHDEHIALQADRILTIEDGKLTSDERIRASRRGTEV